MSNNKKYQYLTKTDIKYLDIVSQMSKEWAQTFYNRINNQLNGNSSREVKTVMKYLEWRLEN